MSRLLRSFGLGLILFCNLLVFSQPQVARPKLQTARQALIEMIRQGGDSIEKHLTVEVQDLLKSTGKGQLRGLEMFPAMSPQPGIETFDGGDILLSFTETGTKLKYEVHVDSDDLSGDEDTLVLSIHAFHESNEQDVVFGLFSSHFSVSLKLQQNIWRLDKVSFGADFPIGDPNFVEKVFLQAAKAQTTGFGLVTPTLHTEIQTSGSTEPAVPQTIPPEQIVSFLGLAERNFAASRPETGFTCSLKDLAETSEAMGINEQVNTGAYNGYRFALSGCEGRPTGSYQIIAEPLVLQKGARAFCSDATGNVRVSEDGRGATCLVSGKVEHGAADGEGTVTFQVSGSETKPVKEQ
jgi:hypothetical protein